VSGSEAGSYLRLIDFVYHSTLDLRVMKREIEGAHVIRGGPLSSELGTCRTVRTRFWAWLSGESL